MKKTAFMLAILILPLTALADKPHTVQLDPVVIKIEKPPLKEQVEQLLDVMKIWAKNEKVIKQYKEMRNQMDKVSKATWTLTVD